jgi:hypothetical protein
MVAVFALLYGLPLMFIRQVLSEKVHRINIYEFNESESETIIRAVL